MLLQLREYIYKQGVVSTQQLMREFSVEEQALQPMLLIWEKKGVIRQCGNRACTSPCRGCFVKKPMYYEYVA